MAPPLLLVVAFYLCLRFFSLALALLNLRHLARHGGTVPPGFGGAVDGERLLKMQEYTLAKTRLGLAESLFGTAVTLIFVFAGVLDGYGGWISGLGLSAVWSGVLFFLLLGQVHTLLHLPFGYYSIFHLENRYGFNTRSLALWLVDLGKELLLAAVLNGLALGVLFWLIREFPHAWWLLTWGFFLCFSVFLMYLAPCVIEPLFNRFSPMADQELEERIREMFGRAGLAVSRVFTMDASRRSTHGNAYFSGIGHVKRIVLFDTLLAGNSGEEILAILAHEAGHWKKKHILKRLLAMEILSFAGCYLLYLLVQGDFLAALFGLEQPTLPVKLFLAGFLGSLVAFPLQPLANAWSRRHEREADDFAAALTGQPAVLARALVKLASDNLANLHPHPFYAAIYYSHPPLVARVQRLLARAEGLRA
ncbi:M48 family metallopeptidase [Thiovibrio sp. JS02]